jgi:hypothetical protein
MVDGKRVNHRTVFLCNPHPGSMPDERTHDSVMSQASELGDLVELHLQGGATKKAITDKIKATGVKGVPALGAGANRMDVVRDFTRGDAMHTFGVFGGKARRHVVERLLKNKVAHQHVIDIAMAIRLPMMMDINPLRIVIGLKNRRVKMVEWVQAMRTGVFVALIQDIPSAILSDVEKDALYAVMRVMGEMASRSKCLDIPGLEARVCAAVRLVEAHLPGQFHTILTHCLLHLPRQIKEWGPLTETWQFGLERLMKHLKGYIHNRASVHGSIMEGVAEMRASLLLASVAAEGRGEAGARVALGSSSAIPLAGVHWKGKAREVTYNEGEKEKVGKAIKDDISRRRLNVGKLGCLDTDHGLDNLELAADGFLEPGERKCIMYERADIDGTMYRCERLDKRRKRSNQGFYMQWESEHPSRGRRAAAVIKRSWYGIVIRFEEVDIGCENPVKVVRSRWYDSASQESRLISKTGLWELPAEATVTYDAVQMCSRIAGQVCYAKLKRPHGVRTTVFHPHPTPEAHKTLKLTEGGAWEVWNGNPHMWDA